MRGLAAAALALAVALPAAAQRGGGHASFSGRSAPAMRSAPAFHSNFAPRPAYRYNGAPLARPPIAYPSEMRLGSPPVHYPVVAPVRRPVFYQPNHGLNGTHRFVLRGYPYLNFGYYPGAIYFPYDSLFDDSYDNYDITQQSAPAPDYSYNYPPDDSYAPPQSAPEPDSSYAYPQPAPVSPYLYPAPGYAPNYAPGYAPYAQAPAPTPQMQYVPGSSDTVTLVFKDGRPPEQIQNYLATRTTLTILDNGRRREVALSDLDLPATMKANRETGVDFELPTVVR